MKGSGDRSGALFRFILLASLLLVGAARAQDAAVPPDGAQKAQDSQVMHAFTRQDRDDVGVQAVPTKEKHLILFIMGVALLIFLLVTAALGVAMAVYGKRVFLIHMIFAGFSVTLAIIHSIVAIVWFFPFSSP
jgi:hypothetical protein